ncbi:MAG TPA: hypothetical protein VGR67_02070 [Candidatus Polarisedimenticolia bacterium]|nr:hypothetical protein [Candidatus Polarisedimenticolia bacterium]
MGGWWLLGGYLALWLLGLASPFLRGRILLLPGARLASVHLLFAAVLLADAAVFPAGIPALPVPAGVAALLAALGAAWRDTWVVLGTRPARVAESLAETCQERGIETAWEGGRLILKRLGTALRVVPAGPGVSLVRLDRRRREAEVDALGEAWRRRLARGAGR